MGVMVVIMIMMMMGMGMIVIVVVMMVFVRMGMIVGMVVGMVVIFLIQEHIEFASIDTGFIHPAKSQAIARHAQTGKPSLQNRAIRAQIQQGSHRHIPGNAGGAF
jgi:hypothetical protein